MKLYKDNEDRYCLADSLGDALGLLQRKVAEDEAREVKWRMGLPVGTFSLITRPYPPQVTSVELVANKVYSDKAPALATGWPPVKEDV
jgi:hypothetical protein